MNGLAALHQRQCRRAHLFKAIFRDYKKKYLNQLTGRSASDAA
jgi:hypothetical protein